VGAFLPAAAAPGGRREPNHRPRRFGSGRLVANRRGTWRAFCDSAPIASNHHPRGRRATDDSTAMSSVPGTERPPRGGAFRGRPSRPA